MERPIIFAAPMVRALMEGRKTQTRRILKPQPERTPDDGGLTGGMWHVRNAGGGCFLSDESDIPGAAVDYIPFAKGDRLWVRENCRGEELDDGQDGVRYKADDLFRPIENTERAALEWVALHTYRGHSGSPVGPWVPSIHMPRWASRITLAVTMVRVQRLQEISEEDARAEGIEMRGVRPFGGWVVSGSDHNAKSHGDAYRCFRTLWNTINGPGSWEANPWVAAITFAVEPQP